ncbi:cytochrome oxidase putative small subunit CydP [Solimonas terrae]|uniref:Uncharacterized protein n=1 Tax=Solimonas terrae TaxID=1396819 RepID=A0A6M2BM56_9GAMM|nr:cytochrome oxidase putative small subunit CydP [Solimonas terrae]NGY03217.1 hypothetical protein [Solimonas terrae]
MTVVKAYGRPLSDDAGLPATLVRAVNTPSPPCPAARTHRSDRLRRGITVVLLVKLLAIVLLWFAFVRPHGIRIDGHRAGESVLGGPASPAPLTEPQP